MILIVAAFMIYQKVDENYRINTAVKQLVTLKTVIQSTYAGQTGYAGLKAENIFHSVPEDLMGDKIYYHYKIFMVLKLEFLHRG